VEPVGSLLPLLITGASEVVAAVWISPDKQIRHYVIPWLPSWEPVLGWLANKAIPEFVPSAVRRIHANVGEDPALQTLAEATARSALVELDEHYRARRRELEQTLTGARSAADDVRNDLLYGRDTMLEAAVSKALTDAGCTVTSLDADLGRRRTLTCSSNTRGEVDWSRSRVRRETPPNDWLALRETISIPGRSYVPTLRSKASR
jgi:hypothetical protein